MLGYEIPCNNFGFDDQAYVGLEERHLQRKVDALALRLAAALKLREPGVHLERRPDVWDQRERVYAEVFEVYRVVAEARSRVGKA